MKTQGNPAGFAGGVGLSHNQVYRAYQDHVEGGIKDLFVH